MRARRARPFPLLAVHSYAAARHSLELGNMVATFKTLVDQHRETWRPPMTPEQRATFDALCAERKKKKLPPPPPPALSTAIYLI